MFPLLEVFVLHCWTYLRVLSNGLCLVGQIAHISTLSLCAQFGHKHRLYIASAGNEVSSSHTALCRNSLWG